MGYQVHIPPASLATASKALCKAHILQAPGGPPTLLSRARPQTHPKRAHPARQAHQPLGPGTASHPPSSILRAPGAGATRAESTSVFPTVPAPRSPPLRAPQTRDTDTRTGSGAVTPHGIRPKAAQRRVATRHGSREPTRLTPRRSQRPTRLTVARPPQPSHVYQASTPGPTVPHPWRPLHLVSAHPPCSRKGPLLPACGLKRPRRVKREATNSRF